MRENFDRFLASLNSKLFEMAAMTEQIIAMAVKSHEEQNLQLAKEAVEFDHKINDAEREIERICLKCLLQYQPVVATDLRRVSTALKMITDMERIGDQAEDIAEIAEYISGIDLKSKDTLNEMAKTAVDMVMKSIESYIEQSTKIAYSVIKEDDTMDELFMNAKKQLICEIQNSSSGNAEALVDILMIAKYFERIGDHAENIAEWVVYSLTGKHDF